MHKTTAFFKEFPQAGILTKRAKIAQLCSKFHKCCQVGRLSADALSVLTGKSSNAGCSTIFPVFHVSRVNKIDREIKLFIVLP